MKTAILCLIVLVSFVSAQNTQPDSTAVVPVEQVLASPVKYSHKIITVEGCYVRAFERTTIQPCASKKLEDMVWVESAESLYRLSKARQGLSPQSIPQEVKSGYEFAFRYDESKSRAAWNRLRTVSVKPTVVILTGQFDTVSPKKANTDPHDFGHGFGHLGQYEHQLILVDVLDVKNR